MDSRLRTARAAAPGPQPISRTRESGFRGSAFTIAIRREDTVGGCHGALELAPFLLEGVPRGGTAECLSVQGCSTSFLVALLSLPLRTSPAPPAS